MTDVPSQIDQAIDQILADERPAQPTEIAPAELPYLQVVADQMELIPQLEAQAQALLARAQAIRGASDSYLLYLFDKYGYDPATTSLERDGRLVPHPSS